MRTSQEHMDWCKRRALEYVNAGDAKNAVTSMLSDLGKHKDTRHLQAFGVVGIFTITKGVEAVREWIEGFRS